MDIKTSKYISAEQIDQVFHYLQREPSLQDYLRLYPDYENRFPVLFGALPETFILEALTMLDQMSFPKSDLDILNEHFSLSNKEGHLALLLLAGHSIAEIAVKRKVSRNTVRNQLQSIYDKTATNKQPELIRSLHDLLEQK